MTSDWIPALQRTNLENEPRREVNHDVPVYRKYMRMKPKGYDTPVFSNVCVSAKMISDITFFTPLNVPNTNQLHKIFLNLPNSF